MHLPRALEDYLKSILILQQKNGTVRSLDVAEMLHVTKPSVSRAMKTLREGGFLTMDADKLLCLTEKGFDAASQVCEKHCILKECLLSMGVEPDIAEKDACRMEHVISEETLERMKRFTARKNTDHCA